MAALKYINRFCFLFDGQKRRLSLYLYFIVILALPFSASAQFASVSLTGTNRDFNVIRTDRKEAHYDDPQTTGAYSAEIEAIFEVKSKKGFGFFYGAEGFYNTKGYGSVNICFGLYQELQLKNWLLAPRLQTNIKQHEFNLFLGTRIFPVPQWPGFFTEGLYDLYRDDQNPVFSIGYNFQINY
jgi:hypothetical protein